MVFTVFGELPNRREASNHRGCLISALFPCLVFEKFLSSPVPVNVWRASKDFAYPWGYNAGFLKFKAKSNIVSPPMDFFVARNAQGHQIFFIVSAAIGERSLVMHQSSQFDFSLLMA